MMDHTTHSIDSNYSQSIDGSMMTILVVPDESISLMAEPVVSSSSRYISSSSNGGNILSYGATALHKGYTTTKGGINNNDREDSVCGTGIEIITTTTSLSSSWRKLLFSKMLFLFQGIIIGIMIMLIYEHYNNNNNITIENNHENIIMTEQEYEQQQQQQNQNQNKKQQYHNTSRYTHTQTLGFQIYVGGAPAFLLNNDNEKDDDDEEEDDGIITKSMMNPECLQHQRYGLLGTSTSGEGEFMCYVGHEDPFIDVKERIRILSDALDKAYQVSDKISTTLKIFIVPEFYFRGIDGAYEFEQEEEEEENNDIKNKNNFNNSTANQQCGPVCYILKELENLVANQKYEDWFFVFGTIVAYDKVPDRLDDDNNDKNNSQQPLLPPPKDLFLFYNFAPIYKGYDPNRTNHHGKRFLLPKRYTSGLDFLTPQRIIDPQITIELIDQLLPTSNETLINPLVADIHRYNSTIWETYKDEIHTLGYHLIEYDWIIVDGITFTIEICLDHYRGTALQSYLADLVTGSTTLIPQLTTNSHNTDHTTDDNQDNQDEDVLEYVNIPRHQAHISIVASAGMTINPNSMALTNDGTIYLQDGLYADPLQIIWSNNHSSSSSSSTTTSTSTSRLVPKTIVETLGGSEAIQRNVVLSPTDVLFQYELVPELMKIPLYDDDMMINTKNTNRIEKIKNSLPTTNQTDDTDTETTDTTNASLDWIVSLNGTFSTERHEPMIVVWGTREIPMVYDE